MGQIISSAFDIKIYLIKGSEETKKNNIKNNPQKLPIL